MKNETIDEIRERYKYEIDITDSGKTASMINNLFYAELLISFKKYCFPERIKKLNEILGNNKNKIEKNTLKSYIKEVKAIEDTIKQIMEKQKEDYSFNSTLLYKLTKQCEYDLDNEEIINLYNNIGKDILDKEVKNYIKIEKLFINFKDSLIDITNKLKI